MSGPSEYTLKLSPYSVSVSVDIRSYEVFYSGWFSSPSSTGPSFVEMLSMEDVQGMNVDEQALVEVCRQVEHMVDVTIDYDDIGKYLVEGSLDGTTDGKDACPGCNGKGKYIGAWEIEDPCKQCNGEGLV